MIRLLFAFVFLVSCLMSFMRYKKQETGYAIAWLCCALINAWCLIRYTIAP